MTAETGHLGCSWVVLIEGLVPAAEVHVQVNHSFISISHGSDRVFHIPIAGGDLAVHTS